MNIKILFLSLSFLVVIASCKKDTTKPVEPASMTAFVDGEKVTVTDPIGKYENKKLDIGPKESTDVNIDLTIGGLESIQKGTFKLDQSIYISYNKFLEFGTYVSQKNGGSGEIVITDVNTTDSLVSGTFNAVLVNILGSSKKTITEGKFTNIKYTIPEPKGNSSMSMKVDGSTWKPSSVNSFLLGSSISVSATTGTRTLGLKFSKTITKGEHDLVFGGNPTGQYNADANTFLGVDSGTITILENNPTTKKISGSFAFKASELSGDGKKVDITNGEFTIFY